MSSTFQRAGQLGMSYIPAGMGSKDSGAYAANCDATGYDSASVVLGSSPPRSRIAASGARNFMLSSSAENNHNQHDLDDSYAIDSYSIQPLKSDIIQSSALYGNLGNTSETISNIGTHAVSSASTGGETSGGRRGRRHPLSSSASSSVLADLDFDIPGSSLDTDRISSGAVGTKGSSKDGPTPAEVRKRQLELEVKRLELELLGKEASNSTAVIDSAGNTEFSNNSHSTKTGKGTWAESNSISAPTVGKITTDDKSRQALEEALAVMQMQNKMLAKRIEENEKEAQRSLEEEVERRTRAALAAAERKAESEKKDLLELERGKRLLMISQIEDEAAAKLMREQEDKELLEQERLKLEAKLKMMELAEKRHEEELREELSRREQEQRTRDLEREQRERDLRVELEENKRRLMEEIVSSEQEKAKANMQAQIELLEQQYQASLQSQRDRMAQEHEVQEHQARLKLEEETSRVRSELTSHYERENARLLQLQEESQRELEKEREEMRAAHKRMEQEKERLLHHMRQTEEKAREELVLAELTKSEYVSNMQRMEKEQKSLQAKMKELDANAKRAADIQAAGNGIDGDTQAIVAQQVAAALSEERAKLEHAFKDLESQKAQIAQTLTETEKESKKHQEQLAAQIAQEKAEVDAKIQQMHKEKEEMTSHLALTLKESQSQTRVIQEKMEAEKEDLVRIMQQREQEKLDVLLKLQQTQTKMEVEIIERELLQRTKAEIAAADSKLAPAVAAAEDKQSLEFSLSESKALSPRAIATSVSDAKEAKEGPYQTSKDSVVYTSETKLAQIDAEAASHKAAAEALAQEREQLRLQLQQFAKEKEELAAQLALAERTAKARQDLAAQHANREKEELKAAVQRMREELRLEKEAAAAAATTAAREASTGGFNSSGSELGNGVGIAEARGASIAVAEGEQTQTLKPSKSLFNMFEEVNSTNEKPLQLPRTLSKALVQAMPHTIDAIPEGEEGTADVFGIDSDDESAALSRHGSGASLGSRIRREKAIDLKNQAAAKEAAAARQAAEAKSADGTATSTQSTTVAASPTAAAAANSFEDLPAPHAAAASGDLTRLKVLGKLQLSLLSSLDGAQRCPLFYAVAYGQEEVTDYLVEQAPDMVDSVDSHGDTPVHAAASGGNTECVRILLSCKEMRSKERSRKKWERERHSLGKSCTEEDWTAHEAQEEHKKDPEVADTRNAMKMTPSHLARTPDVLELLYSYGADMSAVDANGRSPLFVSCAMNREPCTEYIIQCLDRERKTEELYEKDNRGDTPLHAAACNGSVECLLLLLQFGVDPTVANSKGLKAIDLAARNNQTKCRNLLAEYHLHFCTSSEFDSVLFLATLEGHRQVKAAESAGEEASYEIIKKKSSFSGAANAMNGGGGGGLKHVQSMFSLKTNKSLRLQRWGEWIAYEDQQTDKVYWYNSVTSKGQWEKPQSVAKMQMDTAMGTGGGSPGSRQLTSKKSMRLKKYGDWIEYVTDTSQTFFYNEKNGEFQWHAPPGHPKYRADGAASSPQTSVAAAMLAASSSQSPQNETMENQFVDPNDPDAPHGNGKGGGSNNEWQPYKDPDSGSIFWYNSVTHVSQWECPFDDVDFTGPTESTGVTGEKHDSDDDDAQEVLDADDLGI